MKMAPVPADEAERIADLQELELLDTPRESRFDQITDLMADVFNVPMVFITLIDNDRQWYKSTFGAGDLESSPRATGFCAHAICEPAPMVLLNVENDERFFDHPNVTGDFHVRFYAGTPIHGPAGKTVGMLSIIDTAPREFSTQQLAMLQKFGALVDTQLQA